MIQVEISGSAGLALAHQGSDCYLWDIRLSDLPIRVPQSVARMRFSQVEDLQVHKLGSQADVAPTLVEERAFSNAQIILLELLDT
ncbi:MAG: hypothetical protein V3V10_10265, partial [Planctomycetota bacterium]